MKKHIYKLLAVSALTVGIWVLAPHAQAAAATLSLSPSSGSVSKGSTIRVGVRVNSGSDPVNGVEAYLTYPADKLDYVSISGGSFDIVASGSGGGGNVHFERGKIGAVTGSQTVTYVTFRAKVDSGSASVNFGGGSKVVRSTDNQNIYSGGSGGTYTLTVPPAAPPAAVKDTAPPTISAVSVSDITANTATVNWTTSEGATSVVEYGTTTQYGIVASADGLGTAHKVPLNTTLLLPGMTYHYRVKSADAAGNLMTGQDATFTTKGLALAVTITDANGKAIKGAKVTIAGQTLTTDAQGLATFSNLSVGKQTVVVNRNGSSQTFSVEIKTSTDPAAVQKVTFKFTAKTLPLMPIFGLLAILVIGGLGFLVFKKLRGRGGGGTGGLKTFNPAPGDKDKPKETTPEPPPPSPAVIKPTATTKDDTLPKQTPPPPNA